MSNKKFYIGHTENIERRLLEHNNGVSPSTKGGKPWKLVWSKVCDSRSAAMKFESFIKKKKSSKYIAWLVTQTG